MSSTEKEKEKDKDSIDETVILVKKKGTKKPKTFLQQRLKAWIPILLPKNVAPLLFLVGLYSLSIGLAVYLSNSSITTLSVDYTKCDELTPGNTFSTDNINSQEFLKEWRYSVTGETKTCILRFNVPKEIKGPVYFFYGLTNFYQNFRRYERSISFKQLEGEALKFNELEDDCFPLIGLKDKSKVYYPCGIRANSMFTDIFSSVKKVGTTEELKFSEKDVAWSSEYNRYKKTKYSYKDILPPPSWKKFLGYEEYENDDQVVKIFENPRFLNWMKSALTSNFRKLLMKMDDNMPTGNYEIAIDLNYDVKTYKGTKSFIITNISWFGTRNNALAIIGIVFGVLSLFCGFLILFSFMFRFRELGDKKYLEKKVTVTAKPKMTNIVDSALVLNDEKNETNKKN